MESLRRDLGYALRSLLKHPGFTAVALLSLALGIGANATIFSVVNALLLSSLPVADPERLVAVYGTDAKNQGGFLNYMPVSQPNFDDYREQNDVMAGMFAFQFAPLNLAAGGEPEQSTGLLVSGNYFDLLGVRAIHGRTFLPEEDRAPTHPVAVLGYGLWQRRFGGDAAIVGREIRLNDLQFTVIGIAPENFRGTNLLATVDVWVPLSMGERVTTGFLRDYFRDRRAMTMNVIGRLKDGVAVEQAEASLKTIASRLEAAYPRDNEKRSVQLIPLQQASINPALRRIFVNSGRLLMGVVALVLLVACANVANLLLARAAARRKEIAVRLALGATRARLVRQLLTESLLLALLGAGLGLFIAVWGRELLWAFRPPFLQNAELQIGIDWRVLGFVVLMSAATGLLFGLVPALRASRSDLVAELKDKSSQANQDARWWSLRNALVVAQVALSLIGLVGAGLFAQSLIRTQQIDPGFESDRLLVMSFNPGAGGYDEARGREFQRRVLAEVHALPGVGAAALASNAPFGGGFQRSITVEGREPPAGGRGILTTVNDVTPGYFDAAGIKLRRGRGFNAFDREGAPHVAIINEAAARRFWPDEDPVGKRYQFFGEDFHHEVVGVAADTVQFTLGEDPQPQIYLPLEQHYSPELTLHVQTTGAPDALMPQVRRAVQSLDSNLPIFGAASIGQLLDQALWAPRMGAGMLGLFALLALALACIGLYGVLSYNVAQRTQEIGVRMALGASSRTIFAMVLSQGLTLVGVGAALGVLGGLAATQLVAGFLFGVSAADPLTFIITPLVLGLVGLAAAWLPARRATRVDPLVALRYE
ncbi:MAG: ABC transporter permease [Blastocatellales bacterium]|nr:ABC transporter permease [Blastocatellales bacterium]